MNQKTSTIPPYPLATAFPVHSTTHQALTAYLRQPTQALLLDGTVGIGKTLLARGLAASMLQTSEQKVTAHPYYRELAHNKAVIPIDEVRALNAFVSRMVPGKKTIKRVVAIPEAQHLTIPAQNALLKLLEEPPADTVFIVTSSVPHQLLPTIRSRLQILHVVKPSMQDCVEYFEGQGFAAAACKHAYMVSDGNMTEMLAILQNEQTSDVLALVKKALSGDHFSRLLMIEQDLKQKDTAALFVTLLLRTASASLVTSVKTSPAHNERWSKVQEAALRAENALQNNANVKLVLIELMLAM